MKLFSEKVKKTFTNSNHNILQVENFSEIFFNVFEIEINKSKYPVEKISEYEGNPVVSVPVWVEGTEIFYPFILNKGKFEVLFNENNTLDKVFPGQEFEKVKETSIYIEEEIESIPHENEVDHVYEEVIYNKKNILAQIEQAKKNASNAIKREKALKLKQISEAGEKQNIILGDILEEARENLVGEFLDIADKLRKELVEESALGYSELRETINNKLSIVCEELESQLKDNFSNATNIFDSKIKDLVKDLYMETVSPRVEKELKDIALQIVEKVEGIEATLDKKLETKAEKTLVEGVSKELLTIQQANIELNDNINKGVNKALSRAGNVKILVEKIDKELNDKISTELSSIENYFDERIQNIQEQTFDITEESRKYIIDLVNKSKVDLLEEIRKIPTEKPVEYIIESNKKNPEKVNLDKLKKEYDTIIHNKFENYKTDLRKYIAVYSGGGSVAMQFADGGVMNGNLVVVGSISASQYLGITGGGASTDTLDDVTSRGNTTNNTISVSGVDVKYIQFDVDNTPLENAEGLLQWNATDGTLDMGMDGGDITMQLGQEMFTKVRNQTGETIPNGRAVYFSGRSGNRPLIELAKSDNDSTSRVAGITTQDITSPSDGFITTVGYVRGIKTNYVGSGTWGNTWNEGDILYVSKTDAGVITNMEPSSPHHADIIGSVGIVHSNLGSILVALERHITLENLSDVNGTPLTKTGQIPVWNNSTGYFDFDYNLVDSLSTKANLNSVNTFTEPQTFTNSISALSASISGNLVVDTNTLFVDSVNNRVGIGTVTPAYPLDIVGNAYVNGSAYVSSLVYRLDSITGVFFNTSTIFFNTAGNTRMTIGSTGNVGIGTSAPIAKLHILDTTLAGSAGLSGSALRINQTWNTNRTPTALSVNVTDLSSNTSSMLMDLQVGGSSRFRVEKNATIRGPRYIYGQNNEANISFETNWSIFFNTINSTTPSLRLTNSGNVLFTNDRFFGWDDLNFYRDGVSNTLAQRNGTNAQTSRIYNTYTTSSNYERLNLRWDTNVAKIGTQKGSGGGSARDLAFETDAVEQLRITSLGNVGIGTTTPTAKLDVNGTLNVAGNTVLLGATIATGKVTANGQPSLSALADNDVLTKSLGDGQYVINNRTAIPLPTYTSASGANQSWMDEQWIIPAGTNKYSPNNSYAAFYFRGKFVCHNNGIGKSLQITPPISPSLVASINGQISDQGVLNCNFCFNVMAGAVDLLSNVVAARMRLPGSGAGSKYFRYRFSTNFSANAGDVIVMSPSGHTFIVDTTILSANVFTNATSGGVTVRSVTGGGSPSISDTSLTVNGGPVINTTYQLNSATNSGTYPTGILFVSSTGIHLLSNTFGTCGYFILNGYYS